MRRRWGIAVAAAAATIALAGCSAAPTSETAPLREAATTQDALSAIDVQWEFHQSPAGPEQVPTSEVYGPFVKDGEHRAGFQRSPGGAVVAGAQLLFRGSSHREQVESHYLDGAPKEAMLRTLNTGSQIQATFLGFKVDSYTDDAATITYRIGLGYDFKRAAAQLDLRWVDDDWRVNLPYDTKPYYLVWPLESSAGFVPFRP